MMKVKLLFWIALILSVTSSCVMTPGTAIKLTLPKETISRYSKFIPSDEELAATSMQTFITKLPDGSLRKRVFYPEKYQCTHEMTLHPENKSQLHGTYKEWWDNGFKKDEGQYILGERSGEWKTYSKATCSLTKVINFKEGQPNGKEESFEKGTLISSYTYKLGTKEGPFAVYDSLGLLINEGIYKADTIFSENPKYEKEKLMKTVEKMPKFPGCKEIDDETKSKHCAQEKMLRFIFSNIKYPSYDREYNIQGTAIIRFRVEKDGSISNIETMRGVSKRIEAECLRLINLMPKWDPGYQNGEPVKVQFDLPIKFKLQ